MVFLVRARSAENIDKQTDRRKTLKKRKKTKNEKYKDSQIITINIFGINFYIKILFYSKT